MAVLTTDVLVLPADRDQTSSISIAANGKPLKLACYISPGQTGNARVSVPVVTRSLAFKGTAPGILAIRSTRWPKAAFSRPATKVPDLEAFQPK
ncbi:hypothetical protein E4191_03745 [Paracoccus liaowanqingii]|uniref:Uncharacterized protein n=1 Tax=Paracoccus liaowanqingii TaxID=2560053 RepID=A0A4P7HLC8_9RHOB|nr:hypothetical protein [Paracoccus liaowanqingii]QBX33921.1 hypothetical protein E4191_03745 [Paracoccus liaowanqingii]